MTRAGSTRGRDLRRNVQPGDFDVLVGTSAKNLPCRGPRTVGRSLREVGHHRRLVTPVDVAPTAGDAGSEQGAE